MWGFSQLSRLTWNSDDSIIDIKSKNNNIKCYFGFQGLVNNKNELYLNCLRSYILIYYVVISEAYVDHFMMTEGKSADNPN